MKNDFRVTFEVFTAESSEHGEAVDFGFESEACTLRDAIKLVGRGAQGIEANVFPCVNPRWFTVYQTDYSYATGEVTNKSVHFPDRLTPSTRRRICRLVGIRCS